MLAAPVKSSHFISPQDPSVQGLEPKKRSRLMLAVQPYATCQSLSMALKENNMRVSAWCLAVLLLLCGCWFDSSSCYSNGSVSVACENMLPVHDPFSSDSGSPPFTLSASADTYRPGERITVTLEVRDNSTSPFQGFFVQARSSSRPDLWPVGKFTDLNTNSAVSQANGAKRTKVQLTWEAPDGQTHGDVHFRATVVQSYSKFWLNVTSASVVLQRSPGAPAAVASWTVLVSALSLCFFTSPDAETQQTPSPVCSQF
ncbi:hypothetical protein WMY93_003313 [Mugilogobius chulae]|uniref:Reelin domain-containing protein n=1 Tax=Mugilogobius chulae TaxID=88201 RepID=A0AAW0Q6Z6_9GOBI